MVLWNRTGPNTSHYIAAAHKCVTVMCRACIWACKVWTCRTPPPRLQTVVSHEQLTVLVVPPANWTNTSAVVAAITHYEVQVRGASEGESAWRNASWPHQIEALQHGADDGDYLTVSGLQAYAQYVLRARVYNAFGNSMGTAAMLCAREACAATGFVRRFSWRSSAMMATLQQVTAAVPVYGGTWLGGALAQARRN